MGIHSAWCLDFSEARRAASERRFCSAQVGSSKVSDLVVDHRKPSETDSKDAENAKRSYVPADLDSSIIFFHLSKCA